MNDTELIKPINIPDLLEGININPSHLPTPVQGAPEGYIRHGMMNDYLKGVYILCHDAYTTAQKAHARIRSEYDGYQGVKQAEAQNGFNVLEECYEEREGEIRRLKSEFECCQRALNNYLNLFDSSLRTAFPDLLHKKWLHIGPDFVVSWCNEIPNNPSPVRVPTFDCSITNFSMRFAVS